MSTCQSTTPLLPCLAFLQLYLHHTCHPISAPRHRLAPSYYPVDLSLSSFQKLHYPFASSAPHSISEHPFSLSRSFRVFKDLGFGFLLLEFRHSSKFIGDMSHAMDTVAAQAAGSANPPCCPFVPLCFECGTRRNPCHCRILGPTVGFVAFAVAAVVEWPVGMFVYCFRHLKGRRIMAHPAAVVYPRVSSCFPI